MMDSVIAWFAGAWDAFWTSVEFGASWVADKVVSWGADALVALIEVLPELSSVVELYSGLSWLAGGTGVGAALLYFVALMDIKFGLSVVLGAYVARFILRRIPGIG